MDIPNYLVEDQNGNVYGYFNEQILRCDLAIHRRDGEPAKKVLKLASSLPVCYVPVCTECGEAPSSERHDPKYAGAGQHEFKRAV